ncbi:MAG: hypothetical protein ACAH59_10620, partial [Pseudobdellovibrionaceae bacterium]
MDTLKMDLKHGKLLIAVVTLLAAWPSFVQKHRVISFRKILTIQTSKAEPPRVAFDEVHQHENKSWNEWDLLRSKPATQLTTEDEWSQFATRSPVQSLTAKKIVLRQMVFSRGDIERSQNEAAWLDQLPPADQRRLQMAQEKFSTLDQDWELPSFRKLAAEKIEEVKKELDASKENQSPVIVQSLQADGTILDRSSVQTADVQVRNENGLHQLSGMIEVKGLPSGSSQWQIQMARYENEVPKESARVDMKNSTYDIGVAKLSGTLKAQMVDTRSGLVLGEGVLKLSQYSSRSQAQKAKITIEKVTHDVAGRFGDFYKNPEGLMSRSTGRQKPISAQVLLASLNTESKTDEKGTYHFDQIQKGSWGILRTEAKGYQSAMFLVQSGSEKQMPLFPQAMMQALKKIIRDQSLSSEVAETGSVVWGQVMQDGRPLAGAEVDVEFMEQYHPVYFNSLLLPDPNLKATSENGYFAILHLPEGFHSLVASHGQT